MKIIEGELSGILIFEPTIYKDSRGYFIEIYQAERFLELGIPAFVQDNYSRSKKDVIRGLHYQHPLAQGKLVGVTKGSVWDVAVDLRRSSSTFGQWFGLTLDDQTHRQMYIPPGFAHGFCVLSDYADFYYKCTQTYAPQYEQGIAWNDQQLNITWPVTHPILSSKDAAFSHLNEINHENFFA